MAVTKSTTFSEPELDALMIAGNYSTLKITIKFSPNNSQTYFTSKTLKCTCDGVEQTKSVSLSQGGSVSKTFTFTDINHDADGTKNVSWSWSIATGTTVLGTLKDSGTRELQTIPRASELSVSSENHYFGEDIQVTTTSRTFTKNTISYAIFGQQRGSYNTGYLIPNTTHTNNVNFGLSLLSNIPNSTSATATFTCASTFAVNGSSIPESDLGTSTLQVNLQVPDSVKPTCSIGTLSEANSTMLSFSPRWNIFVQNHSQINIPITANGIYGSKITSIKVTTNEETFNYNVPTPNTTINYTFTTGLLKTSGSNTINVEVTDTRGRKGTTSTTYNVVAYSSPIISSSSTSVARVSSGTAGQDNLKYSFVGNSNNIGNNASMTTFKVGYKLKDSSSYTYMTSETLTGSSSINRSNATVATPTFSSDSTYDIQFYVKDAFNEVSVVKELETEGDLLNFNDNGKAMAIGKVSEAGANEELLEIALPTYATEKIETTKSLRIPKSGAAGYGLCNSDGTSIIRDYNNTHVTVNATGGTLFLGHATTNDINFLNGKATINSNGVYSGASTYAIKRQKSVALGSDNANTSGWYKVCSANLTGYGNHSIAWLINDNYYDNYYGIYMLNVRGGNGTLSFYENDWIVRSGFKTDDIRVTLSGTTWTLYIKRTRTQYGRISFTELQSYNINGENLSVTYYNSTSPESSTPTASRTSRDWFAYNLYENSTGATSGTITLSETSANFTYLEIFYYYEDSQTYSSIKIFNPNGKKALLEGTYDNGTYLYKVTDIWTISGTSLSKTSGTRWRFGTSGSPTRTSGTTLNDIYIYKVIGIR